MFFFLYLLFSKALIVLSGVVNTSSYILIHCYSSTCASKRSTVYLAFFLLLNPSLANTIMTRFILVNVLYFSLFQKETLLIQSIKVSFLTFQLKIHSGTSVSYALNLNWTHCYQMSFSVRSQRFANICP